MEHEFPETCAVITSPHVETLVISNRVHTPFRKGQQRCRVHDGVVNHDFIPFHDSGQNLSAQREAVGNVQMPVQVFPNVLSRLNSLVIDRGILRLLTEQKSINSNRDNVEFVLQQFYQRQEYLVGYP